MNFLKKGSFYTGEYRNLFLEKEYINRRIRINTISPGLTQTGLTPDFETVPGKTTDGESIIESMFLNGWNGRYATPEEMGYPLVFLNSKVASYITGQDLNISFGQDAFYDIQALDAKVDSSLRDTFLVSNTRNA